MTNLENMCQFLNRVNLNQYIKIVFYRLTKFLKAAEFLTSCGSLISDHFNCRVRTNFKPSTKIASTGPSLGYTLILLEFTITFRISNTSSIVAPKTLFMIQSKERDFSVTFAAIFKPSFSVGFLISLGLIWGISTRLLPCKWLHKQL